MVKLKAKTARQYAEAMIAVLPKVNPSSSSSGCDDASSYRKLFAEALEEMIMDESSVVSVLSQLRSRRETMVKARAELSLLPPMPVVGKIDVGVMAGAIADHSDMTSNEVATLIEKYPEAPVQLFTFIFGLHSGNKLSVDMREAGVFSQVMTARDSRFGHRGAGFKQNGGIVDGRVNWKRGVYRLHFDDTGHLRSTTHASGDSVNVGDLVGHITRDWSLEENWFDVQPT